ncbi:MAG TPA: TOMM precursor leader peptide-binding protein [Gaiellaceae bacterium]|nr:TOMM precursor leader peptide-binding protein [Gaiellaceae bacterium]
MAPWYRLVEDGDRLVLEHGRSAVVLEGRAVRALLPRLLPLLDGTRSGHDLAAELGVAIRPAIDQVLELLAASGLLLDGPTPAEPGCPAARVVAAAYGLSPSDAAARLGSASLGVVGSGRAGAEVARLLHAAGVGEVRKLSWRPSDHAGRLDLAVVTPSPHEAAELAGWNTAALESGLSWLGARPFDGRVAMVGPLVVPGESCCHECLLHRLAGHVEYGSDLAAVEAVPVEAGESPTLERIAAGVTAHLALCWLGGRDPALPGVLYAIEARPRLAFHAHTVLRVPRCPACSPVERRAPRVPWHEAEIEVEVA